MDGNPKDSIIVNNHSISYSQEGQGEPIVFVHGALADARMWQEHCKILSKEFKVISFTQRHFGNPHSRSEGPFGIDTHTKDLIRLIETLDVGPIHLVGWSYGADVSLNAVVKAPQLFKSLYLYEPGYPGYLCADAMAGYQCDAKVMFTEVFKATADNHLDTATKQLIDGSGNRAGYFSQQPLKYRVQQLDNAFTLPLQLNQTEQPALNPDSLTEISIPVSVAYGSDTRQIFKIVSCTAGALIPNTLPLEVDSANHMLPLEDPSRFCKLVRGWVRASSPKNSETNKDK
ncbi:alpha/beta fold hydrolase [Microbulbifer sp. JMSA003]|uniref:alpha/beta fold hydrolase n=1 Tax=Microbulbifer sp. JMSA003 TaxID=3243369 RepID=UPI004039BF8C